MRRPHASPGWRVRHVFLLAALTGLASLYLLSVGGVGRGVSSLPLRNGGVDRKALTRQGEQCVSASGRRGNGTPGLFQANDRATGHDQTLGQPARQKVT